MDTINTISQRLYELAGEAKHYAQWVETQDDSIDGMDAVNDQIRDAISTFETTIADIHYNLYDLQNEIYELEQ